jgi:hypothetical protein
MKRILKISIIFSLFICQLAIAQTDSSKQDLQFKIGINFNSALNYYGRTDSLKSTGIFPMAELWLSKDVYINAAPVFVNNALQSMEYAGTITSIGYLHSTDKWISNLYLLKPFYKQTSSLVQSALKAQSGASFSKLNKILNITLGGDVKFSDKTDYGATAGVDHLIRKELKNSSVLVIDPSFYAYAGTQNFTSTYNRKRNNFLLFPGGSEEVNKQVTKFNILAFEGSLPVIYAKEKWMVLLTPSYVLPQNLVTITGRPDLSEKGENTFYVTLGLKYTF